MTRGRKRKHDPSIPAHIDQARLPAGLYWDRTGAGRWYVRDPHPEGVGTVTRRVAGAQAKLSDLFAIAEERAGRAARGTLGHLMAEFEASLEWQQLSAASKKDYRWCRSVVEARSLSSGISWPAMQVDRMTVPLVQRLVEAIATGTAADPGRPSKANHVKRYLSRLCAWGIRLGLCTTNPAKGVRQASERGKISMPAHEAFDAVLASARERGCRKPHTAGSSPPYLAPLMEIAYLCRLRGSEALLMTDAHASDEGVLATRLKGSKDTVTAWSPRLRAAWDEAVAIRTALLAKPQHRARPVSLRAEDRTLFLSEDGTPLSKSGLDSAMQSLLKAAIAEGVIARADRFTLHGLKHRGITDSVDKKAGGHRTEAMRQRYDHEVAVFEAPTPRRKR